TAAIDIDEGVDETGRRVSQTARFTPHEREPRLVAIAELIVEAGASVLSEQAIFTLVAFRLRFFGRHCREREYATSRDETRSGNVRESRRLRALRNSPLPIHAGRSPVCSACGARRRDHPWPPARRGCRSPRRVLFEGRRSYSRFGSC